MLERAFSFCIKISRNIDPACGTGGFLTSTIAHIGSAKTVEEFETLQTSINGWEKKPLPYLLAMTNLILHDIEIPKIKHINSLNRPLSDYTAKDRVDVIVANPPFGGAEDAAVKQNFPSEFQTSETADLFMALIMNLLKDGGRAGVVLPDGFMFGDGVKNTIKEKLFERIRITYDYPFAAGVQTVCERQHQSFVLQKRCCQSWRMVLSS